MTTTVSKQFKLNKNQVVASSATSVFFELIVNNERIYFWVSKKFIFKDDFSNILKTGIVDEFEYKIYDHNEKIKYIKTGKELGSMLVDYLGPEKQIDKK